jgi:ribosomal protein S18 acetylase RimI-like enzyme
MPVELYSGPHYIETVSVNIDARVLEPGNDELLEDAWRLKERIRSADGVLKQRRGFFADAYRRSTVHVFLDEEDALIGFVAARRDGYILFLAVAPEYRGESFGERLVARIAEQYDTVTCHARASNELALGFYESLGFEIKRRIDNYYEDGGDAYYLKLGDESGIAQRLSDLMGR